MALDNAEFIAELSINDPPGTDPLNQGDDHIRTTKKAVQQSFPNVGSAVPQTGAQMAQMAIKNEQNFFTQVNTFDNVTNFGSALLTNTGTAVGPAYAFTQDTGMGMWRKSPGVLAFSISGTERFSLSSTLAIFNAAIRAADGTAALPSFTFSNQTDQGMYKATFNELGLVAGGVQVARLGPGSAVFPASMFVGVGSATTPGYTFDAQSTMGMFRKAVDELGFSVASVLRLEINTSGIIAKNSILARDASFTNPSYAFENEIGLGIFRSAGGVMSHVSGGTTRFQVKGNTLNMTLPSTNAGLAAGDLFKSGGFVAIV